MKVWMVTSGDYSDYRVEAIFATKALADEAVKKRIGTDICEMDVLDNTRQETIYTCDIRTAYFAGENGNQLHRTQQSTGSYVQLEGNGSPVPAAGSSYTGFGSPRAWASAYTKADAIRGAKQAFKDAEATYQAEEEKRAELKRKKLLIKKARDEAAKKMAEELGL